MAAGKKKSLRTRTTVPVSSRSASQRHEERASSGAKRKGQRVDIVSVGVLVAVMLVILLSIAVPLRNYYEGRAEIARLNESIAAKEAEKAAVEEEIELYQDDDFVREQARRRLGLVAPGETSYRIIDPRINSEGKVTRSRQDYEDSRPWYEVLWESVAEPAEQPEPTN